MKEVAIYSLIKDIILIFVLGVGVGAIAALAKGPELIEVKKPVELYAGGK